MRRLMMATAMLAVLGGCHNVREGLGQYKRLADKGVELRVGGQAPDAEAAANAGEPARGKRSDPIGSLPGGLGGDPTHPAYSEPTPR